MSVLEQPDELEVGVGIGVEIVVEGSNTTRIPINKISLILEPWNIATTNTIVKIVTPI
ncbi:hypothetical protein [Nostoc sp. ATCC 53789]|uniref:hypothetical protein n=1 Tax=Nostoc sp. ATCC 53789 TaxID=76335 RepID=UPI00132F2E15|nr:hypothetical protein [Nostoc sp. ATCC 53789]QHG21144.1 hypothetical protein GJB62_35425 [Nostoc sp. ATCC 53789]